MAFWPLFYITIANNALKILSSMIKSSIKINIFTIFSSYLLNDAMKDNPSRTQALPSYLRFVIHETDSSSGKSLGLFHAMAYFIERGELEAYQVEQYEEIYKWFKHNLRVPKSFTRSTKPHAKKVALSWFKSDAGECIQKMRIVEHILKDYGVDVRVLQTSRPGYIVYEDEHQVAAEPFSDTAV